MALSLLNCHLRINHRISCAALVWQVLTYRRHGRLGIDFQGKRASPEFEWSVVVGVKQDGLAAADSVRVTPLPRISLSRYAFCW
eukprot:SAG11_NODE_938_length_6471_cov_4.156780_3_plen_84_part_00